MAIKGFIMKPVATGDLVVIGSKKCWMNQKASHAYVILFLSCGGSKKLTIPKELLTLQIWFLAISG